MGYDVQLRPVLERYAAQFGKRVTYDRRGTPYIELEGQDNSKTVLLGAHADTLGLMVRHIEADGKIRVRALGQTLPQADGRVLTELLAGVLDI